MPNVNENVLKVNYKKNSYFQSTSGSTSGSSVWCYTCGKPGHKSFECKLKKDRGKWCRVCRTTTHTVEECRKVNNRPTRPSSGAAVNICKPKFNNNDSHSDDDFCKHNVSERAAVSSGCDTPSDG